MCRKLRDLRYALGDIYSLKDEYSKGRFMSLLSSLITAFYNVFITGVFYTGFLTMYDIDITGVGIITFIPYIGGCLALFSPFVLRRFPRRKKVVLASKIAFYALFILATTLMPQFVTDSGNRLICFIVILFVAYGQYALFSPGLTVWFYKFYPADNELRTRYIFYNQMFSSVTSSLILLVSGLITDAVSGQNTVILALRYFAFILVILDVFLQSRAKEFPYEETSQLKLRQVFTTPFKNRKFMMCMLLMFFWNFISNLNNGTWNYHLLNHMKYSYTLLNSMSVLYTVLLALTSRFWRKLLRKFSWVRTFGLCNLVWVPTEFIWFMTSYKMRMLYIPLSLWQNFICVGFNLSYANILYMNLPDEDSTSYISFYSVGANLCALLGMVFGTWLVSLHPDTPFPVFGVKIYMVQFTCFTRGITQTIMGLMCFFGWKAFTSDAEIRLAEGR